MAQAGLPGLAADGELLMDWDNDRHVTKVKPTTSSLSRRSVLLAAATLAASAPMQIAQAQQPPSPQSKPNILFMLVDNLGYGELGVYGGGATRGAPTPRLDQLASEGLRLTNMNMEAQCTPSRSAILTGRCAIRSGTHSVPFGASLTVSRNGKRRWRSRCRPPGTRPRSTASGTSAARTAACPTTRASTSGTESRAPPTRRCGPALSDIRRVSCRRSRSWRAARARRAASCA